MIAVVQTGAKGIAGSPWMLDVVIQGSWMEERGGGGGRMEEGGGRREEEGGWRMEEGGGRREEGGGRREEEGKEEYSGSKQTIDRV